MAVADRALDGRRSGGFFGGNAGEAELRRYIGELDEETKRRI